MSIRDEIVLQCGGGSLFLLRPKLPSLELKRHVYVSPKVSSFLGCEPGLPPQLVKTASDCRNMLDAFSYGRAILYSLNASDRKRSAMIKRCAPPELGVWMFRVRDPRPQIRIFGAFSERDCFVALTYHRRDEIAPGTFIEHVTNARKKWNALFPNYSPVVTDQIHALISEPATPAFG